MPGKLSETFVVSWLNHDERRSCEPLWKACFPEDSQAFLDFYYQYKMADNDVAVIRNESGRIIAMLHLNPYTVIACGRKLLCHYIVAVATEEPYRRMGCMARLITHAFRRMYERQEAFCYLEPANKAYYTPFGFRTAYRQPRWTLSCDEQLRLAGSLAYTEISAAEAENTVLRNSTELTGRELRELAAWVNSREALQYDVYTQKTLEYWETFRAELATSGGALMVLYQDGEIRGTFGYWVDDQSVEVLGAYADKGMEALLMHRILEIIRIYHRKLVVSGFSYGDAIDRKDIPKPARKLKIMVRIIHLLKYLQTVRMPEMGEMILKINDPFIPENNGMFLWKRTEEGMAAEVYRGVHAPDITMDIADFAEYSLREINICIDEVV